MHPIPTPSPIPSALLLILLGTDGSLSLLNTSPGIFLLVGSSTPLSVGDARILGSAAVSAAVSVAVSVGAESVLLLSCSSSLF